MGLSSSQGRLLMLTSRLSDIELQQTLLSQRQNQLAMDSLSAAEKYNKAMNNTKIVMKVPDAESKTGVKNMPLSYKNLVDNNYLVVDATGKLYLTKSEEKIPLQTDGAGDFIIPEGVSSVDEENGIATREVWDIPTPKSADGEAKQPLLTVNGNIAQIINLAGDGNEYQIVNGNDWLKNPQTLQNALMSGTLQLLQITDGEPVQVDIDNLESDTGLYRELDTSDDAQAESEYETALARVSRQDNMLEMEVKRLDTQHEAILKELESVKNVISNNVDRTFKLFSNG